MRQGIKVTFHPLKRIIGINTARTVIIKVAIHVSQEKNKTKQNKKQLYTFKAKQQNHFAASLEEKKQKEIPQLSFYVVVIVLVCLFVLVFLGPHWWHVEIPRLGIKSALKLMATATATQDPNLVWKLHCSSQQQLTF